MYSRLIVCPANTMPMYVLTCDCVSSECNALIVHHMQVPPQELQRALTSATLHGGREGAPATSIMKKNLSSMDSGKVRGLLILYQAAL